LQNYQYYPAGTIFLCVVDPGVGSGRQAVAVKTKNYTFIGPDNGLFWLSAEQDGIVETMLLPVDGASRTFHGRDVFARAAGQLASGVGFTALGKQITLQTKLSFHLSNGQGEVVHIDHFGNIITNLPHIGKSAYDLHGKPLSYYDTYAAAPIGELFLITGSSGTLEISLKNGSAKEKFNIGIGERITLA